MKSFLIFATVVFFSLGSFAEAPPVAEPVKQEKPVKEKINEDNPLPKSKWNEVYSIIDEIKVQNPPRNYFTRVKGGIIQLFSNTPDAIGLGLGGNIVGVGLEGVANIWNSIGIEARLTYAQNLFPASSSANTSNAHIYWLDVGPRYTLYFDSTHLDDNVSFKILYHQNDANFQIAPALIFVNHYAGISASVERSIPITRKLGVLASLDLLQIFSATAPAAFALRQSGYGFEVRGEIYYQMELLGKPSRLGISYWQQGNNNELVDDTAKGNFTYNSYFQLARAIFANLTFIY